MMAENGSRDRSHLTLDLKGLKPTPNNDSGLSPIFSAMPLSPEKIQFGTQQQGQAQQPQQTNLLETPTPSNFFTKNPTSAQELFAEGFIEAYRKVQGAHATPINNSPSALKFLHTLFGHLSPNGTAKTFLGQQQQQQTGIVGQLSPISSAKNFLAQQSPYQQQLPSPSDNANHYQLLNGADAPPRLDVPQIVLTNTNNSVNDSNNSLISAAAVAAASTVAASVAQQQSPPQPLNSPISVDPIAAVVAAAAAAAGGDDDGSSSYLPRTGAVTSVTSGAAADISSATTTTTANAYMDYHLAHLGQLSPVVSSAAGTNAVPGGVVDFFQPQLAQFNTSAPIGLLAQQQQQQHATKDIKKEQPSNNAAVGIDHVMFKQHSAAAAAAATQLNGMPLVELRGKLSSAAAAAARSNVLHSLQTHIAAHHHSSARPNLKGAEIGDQDMKKLERKRARNRLAASKCRQRKLQRIMDLEQQVNEEKERGSELQMQINQLQNVIRELEERLKATNNEQPQQQQHMPIISHRQNS